MIADAKAGKIDLIITKNVSRFARNVGDFVTTVRMLAEHNPRIGVFFESENIFSLKEDSQMALSFQATMAEEESRNKSRSMETSLRMRLDHGLPLTPKLLGFQHNEDGKLKSAFAEVCVTRRVYRNGDSEYLLNYKGACDYSRQHGSEVGYYGYEGVFQRVTEYYAPFGYALCFRGTDIVLTENVKHGRAGKSGYIRHRVQG